MHDFRFLLLQLHNKWFKIKKVFESGTVDTVHVPLSPYRMLYLTNILYITCHILAGLLIPYSNCTPRFIESSMNPGLGISIHTYVFYRFIFYVLVRHCTQSLDQKRPMHLEIGLEVNNFSNFFASWLATISVWAVLG